MPLSLETKNPTELEPTIPKQVKIIREIVAEPVDAFYNPNYYHTGFENYTPEEIDELNAQTEDFIDDHLSDFEKKPLNYLPFDPEKELKKIRKFSKEEMLLEKNEKWKLQKDRLKIYKENQDAQKHGIAQTIKLIKDEIVSNSDIDKEKLLFVLKEKAKKYRFTKEQVGIFYYAITEYCQKHLAVERYKTIYPNDSDLFRACFEKEPEGKIQVQKFPMCLLLCCHDFRDFTTAYTYNKNEKTKKELLEKASSVAGCALSKVAINELSDTVIIENVGNNGQYEFDHHIKEHEEIISKDKSVELSIGSIYNDLEIEILGDGKWKLKVTKDSHKNPSQIELINLNNNQQVFEITIHEPSPESKYLLPVFRKKSDPPNALNRANVLERLGKYDKTALINLNGYFLEIENRSPQGTRVSYSTEEFVRFIPNLEFSQKTVIHEIEHQLNKLFVPLEIKQSTYSIIQDTIRQGRGEDSEQVISQITHRLIRFERNHLIDSQARDEILAYYRGEDSLDYIYETLSSSPLYNYSKQNYYQEKIEKMPEDIQNFIKENASELIYGVEENEVKKENNLNFIDVKELHISKKLIKKFIEIVFEKEYKIDLKKWLGSIALMEKKGYSKDEISDLFYQEPINSWSGMAKKIGYSASKKTAIS